MRRVLFVTTLVLIAGTTAFAASVRLLSLSHLVNDSSLIIVAKTLNSTSYWSEHRIYTDFELEPIELWKGQLPPAGKLNLTLLGGIVGELGQYVPSTPKIESNTTYLFYLQPDLKSRWRITGLYQGIAPVDLYSPTPIPGETNLDMPPPTRTSHITGRAIVEISLLFSRTNFLNSLATST